MGILKKRQIGKKKYLYIGKIGIPYNVIKSGAVSILEIAGIRIPFKRYEENGSDYIKLFGFRICLDKIFSNRKLNHYKNRELLTDEFCKKLLAKELKNDLGYVPNIDNPKTFNEKILWMKFYDHNPLITKCCDKYAVKEYVSEVIGPKYVLPVLNKWNKASDIDFSQLPNKFAIKVNWSSGYNIIVKDKAKMDQKEVIKKLDLWMQPCKNSYYDTFNWGYKDMKPVIYAEPYIEQFDGQVFDYKFYICNGKFEFLFIATDRLNNGLTYTFFDKKFNHLPCTYGNKPNASPLPQMPKNVRKMIELAEKLAKPFKFVRVDFYEIDDSTFYVGEMTFYSGGGTLPFKPFDYDLILGEKIKIN